MKRNIRLHRRQFLKKSVGLVTASSLLTPLTSSPTSASGEEGEPTDVSPSLFQPASGLKGTWEAGQTRIAGEKFDKIVPGINDVEPWQQIGDQPYEITWTQREQSPHTVVDFEDMKGWTLELYDGARGGLWRSRGQQMWGMYVAKFGYRATKLQCRVIARPPQPIPIPGRFDSIDLWGYGDHMFYLKDPSSPSVDISVLILDAQEEEFTVFLAKTIWKGWWLIHRRISKDTLERIIPPTRFAGIQISNITNTQLRYFYCDSLAFYEEKLPLLHFKPQPKRNLKPFPGQIVGLNTGPGTLPFPTREETILPTNFEKNFNVKVVETAPHRFEFRYTGKDEKVVYDYSPSDGGLTELTVRVNNDPVFCPLKGGGIRFLDTQPGEVARGKLVESRLVGGVVHATFQLGVHRVEYELCIWQKSLVLDARCEGGEATEVNFGRVSDVRQPRLITVPFITYGGTNPRVLMYGAKSKPRFVSVWFDWYRTNASEPYAASDPVVTPDSAEINGGMRYIPKTDGLRNNLYERIFITVSPNYEETLPTIANPRSIRAREGSQVIWSWTGPVSYRLDHQRCRRLYSYGIEKVMQYTHEGTWNDYDAASFTLRLHAAPQKGGDTALKWYVHAQNEMGWLQGIYSNYTSIAPVNANWSPDNVQRTPDGEWRRKWARVYVLKPSKAIEFDDYYAKCLKDKFGGKMCYTDSHTAVSPWGHCDYDARVPGAGTLAATFYAYGQVLLNDQNVYGPTQSEGTFQWMYAGLESGTLGWTYGNTANLLQRPLDVSFMLRKIHTLEADYGIGETPDYYLSRIDPRWAKSPNLRAYIDLWLSTGIAYGTMGCLVTDLDPEAEKERGDYADWSLASSNPSTVIEITARSYYMMQQLQQQYAFSKPVHIEYSDRAGYFLTPSLALSTGVISESRLHVMYENGTNVYVNRSSSGTWMVKDAEKRFVQLPVSGWLAWNQADNFYEMSALVNSWRIDYVQSKEFEFLDGRGKWTRWGNLGSTGGVALRHRGGGFELIDIYGNDRLEFKAGFKGVLIAYDPDGKALGEVALVSSRTGWYEFKPIRGARRYVFTQSLTTGAGGIRQSGA